MRMILLILGSIACNDYSLTEKENSDVLVHPPVIDFGLIAAENDTGNSYFTITNVNNEPIEIENVMLFNDDDFVFYLDSELDLFNKFTVQPNSIVDIGVEYDPITFSNDIANIEVKIGNSTEVIDLYGYGDAPDIEIISEFEDFGDSTIGCNSKASVKIRNAGSSQLIVNEISQVSNHPNNMSIDYGTLPELPWYLDPEETKEINVEYSPTDLGSDFSTLIINSNDPDESNVEIDHEGRGVSDLFVVQEIIQSSTTKVDIMWVVDDSGSMNWFQQNLATNIILFTHSFLQSNPDFQMTVITTSDHTIYNVLDNNTPNVDLEIATDVLVGTGGSAFEQGMQMSYLALSSPYSVIDGRNFLREDAQLIVIYVSDEPDYNAPLWQQYASTFFDTLKPQGMFIPYGIIGDPPNGCSNAQFGDGYHQLINHYNGEWYSICGSGWGANLQNLGTNIAIRSRFGLDHESVIEDTIEVYVNGQASTSWYYNDQTNAIVFEEGHAPDPGDTISIEYGIYGC